VGVLSVACKGEVGMFKNFFNSIREFLNDVRGELKKVSFPSRAETIGSTTVVIVFCIIMSLYLSFVDSVLVWLVGKIL
jgi:preprotein translocase subunit SecE